MRSVVVRMQIGLVVAALVMEPGPAMAVKMSPATRQFLRGNTRSVIVLTTVLGVALSLWRDDARIKEHVSQRNRAISQARAQIDLLAPEPRGFTHFANYIHYQLSLGQKRPLAEAVAKAYGITVEDVRFLARLQWMYDGGAGLTPPISPMIRFKGGQEPVDVRDHLTTLRTEAAAYVQRHLITGFINPLNQWQAGDTDITNAQTIYSRTEKDWRTK